MVYKITSKSNELIKNIVKIKNDNNSDYFLIDGFHLFEMALLNNCVEKIFTNKLISNIENIDQYVVTDEILNKISNFKTNQGIVCLCKKIKTEFKNENVLIYLDYIQDPGNLGTIFRSGLAFGFKNYLLSPNCVSVFNSKTISASQGAIFNINFITCDINKLKEYKKSGYKLISTSLKNESIYLDEFNINKNEKYIFIFGNEGSGISKEVLDISDEFLKIKIKNIESLNVAIAFSIVMYNLSLKI